MIYIPCRGNFVTPFEQLICPHASKNTCSTRSIALTERAHLLCARIQPSKLPLFRMLSPRKIPAVQDTNSGTLATPNPVPAYWSDKTWCTRPIHRSSQTALHKTHKAKLMVSGNAPKNFLQPGHTSMEARSSPFRPVASFSRRRFPMEQPGPEIGLPSVNRVCRRAFHEGILDREGEKKSKIAREGIRMPEISL